MKKKQEKKCTHDRWEILGITGVSEKVILICYYCSELAYDDFNLDIKNLEDIIMEK